MTRFLPLALYLALVAVAALYGHLRPLQPPEPPPDVAPATYALSWSGTDWWMVLDQKGRYRCTSDWSATLWDGTWSYDRRTRTLTVRETEPAALTWSVTLDRDLAGQGGYEGGVVHAISLRRRP